MSYKTILTYLPMPQNADRILDVAAPLAQKFDAHLIGLHVIPRVPVMYGMVAAQIPPSVITEQQNMLERETAQLEEQFNKRTAGQAATSEWRCNHLEHANIASDIIDQSRCADLIIVAQEETDPFGLRTDIPGAVTYETGRPVLIIPAMGEFESVGKRVMVAWNASRESARAAFDALPMLKAADEVRIVAVDPPATDESKDIVLGEELALTLARHGVSVEVSAVFRDGGVSIGDQILNEAADGGSDLVVMGCYGHSAMRESLFGGATRDMLEAMTVPVLMSH